MDFIIILYYPQNKYYRSNIYPISIYYSCIVNKINKENLLMFTELLELLHK